jgi:CBS domain-containing protein
MKGITLFIFGGLAQMDEEPQNARTEFLMAIAGPVASIWLGVGLLGLSQLASEPSGVIAVLTYLGFINLVLAGFNLLPAFPLDGGRILRSGLWHWKGNLRNATRIASMIGSGFGFGMILLGMLFFLMGNLVSGVWWFLIGLFLRMASRSSFRQLIIRQSLEGESVESFMESDPVTVSPEISLDTLVQDFVYRHHHKMFPVVSEGDLKGCVTTREVKKVPQDQWKTQKVSDVMSQCDRQNTISPESDAMDALSRMNRHQISRLIVSHDSRLIGIVALKDLLRFLSLKMDLEESISVGAPLSAGS